MKFKNYDREYERVFTGDDLIKKKCNIDKISSLENIYSTSEYTRMLQDLMGGYETMVFDFLVKYAWLTRKFCYSGYNRKYSKQNGLELDRAFGVFMRHYVGFDNRMILYSTNWMGKVISYFEDFFPTLSIGNPFEEKYEFPYKYMNLACLFLVYQMDERLDLLEHGEEKRMNHTEFSDYISNYINCYNEEHGVGHYLYIYSNRIAPYIKKKDYGKT